MPKAHEYLKRRQFFPELIAHVKTGAPPKECNAGGMTWNANHVNIAGFKKIFVTADEIALVMKYRSEKDGKMK